MKTFAVIFLAVLMLGQSPVFEGKFVIKVDSWDGLLSDEYLHPGPTSAADMTNFEIKNESGRSFIQQRPGFIYIDTLPSAVTEVHGYFISQIQGDSERVIVAGNNGLLYQKSSNSAYIALNTTGDSTGPFCTFTMFKDTLIVTGRGRVFRLVDTLASPGMKLASGFKGNNIDTTGYNRMFLHQDRIYGYGLEVDSLESKLAWWPEFWLHSFDALPDTITGGGYAYIGKDDGDFLTNVVPQQSHIIAYKSRSIYKVMVSPSTNAPNEIVKIIDNIGAYGYDCVSEWNGNHYFIAENGVYEFDGVNVTKLSDPINYWFADSMITNTTGKAKFFKTCVVSNKLYVTLPNRNISTPSIPGDLKHFVYDLDLKVWYKFDFTGDQASRADTVTFLRRYEYSPNTVGPLTGSVKYGQRLLFTIDSTNNVNRTKLCMFPQGWSDRGTDSIRCTWDGAFFPVVDFYQRFQLERVMVFGSTAVSQSAKMDIYSANDHIIASGDGALAMDSSITIPLVSGLSGITSLTNTRLSNVNQGSLLRYRIRTYGGAPKFNRLEFVGSVKGLAEE